MSRNWQDSFQKGQGFAPKIIDQLSGIEVDLATALAGGAATDGTTIDLNGSGQLEVKGGITEAKLSLSDVTTANASTSAHGLLPKLDGTSTHFLNGAGSWATPAGGGGGTSLVWFNVMDYGAVGDGVTDDSAAIQSAINAAHPALFSGIGSTVYFPAGKYYVATGLTATVPGVTFLGDGEPGVSDDLAAGDTQIIVGNGIFGLTVGSTSTGNYRGYGIEGLGFYEKNAGQALGGVNWIRSSNGSVRRSSFGRFTNSVSTTYAGTNGAALSTLSTLPLTSTTGWPTVGSGYIVTNGGTGGQPYHSFWYTGISGSSLTGVTYGVPNTDTVPSGAQVVAAVGVGFLNNGGGSPTGESSYVHFDNCRFGTCQFGMLQLGVSSSILSGCLFDGHHNVVAGFTPVGTGLMAVTGSVFSHGCLAQAYDVLVHICRGNTNSVIDFRLEGYGSAGVILEPDSGIVPAAINVPGANSQISSPGPAIYIKAGVKNAVISAQPQTNATITDLGTGTRYSYQSGLAQSGASALGNVVGKQPVYHQITGALLGYTPIYDNISGISLNQTIGLASPGTTGLGSVAITLPAGMVVPVGHTIILGLGFGGASTPTVTASDSGGNTYTNNQQADKTTSATPHAAILSAPVTTQLNAGDTITVTFTGSTANIPALCAYDYQGVLSSSFVDVQSGATGTSTSPAAGAISTTADHDLLFSVCFHDSAGTFSAGSGYTVLTSNSAPGKRIEVETQTAVATGSYNGDGALTSSVDWAQVVVAFKKA